MEIRDININAEVIKLALESLEKSIDWFVSAQLELLASYGS